MLLLHNQSSVFVSLFVSKSEKDVLFVIMWKVESAPVSSAAATWWQVSTPKDSFGNKVSHYKKKGINLLRTFRKFSWQIWWEILFCKNFSDFQNFRKHRNYTIVLMWVKFIEKSENFLLNKILFRTWLLKIMILFFVTHFLKKYKNH